MDRTGAGAGRGKKPNPGDENGNGNDRPPQGKKNPDPDEEKKDKDNEKKDKEKDNEEKDKEKDNEKKDKEKKDQDEGPKWYSAHSQATFVMQGNGRFRSPYSGPLSLQPRSTYPSTATATLFLAARPWAGSEIVFNPEMAGGVGLSGTNGLAGFPNGEATRVGVPQPTPYFARLLWKQTIGLGGETKDVPDGFNQVAGRRDVDRITVRLGKMSATDTFDDNAYSHDPRTQFLNWALMYNGAWDYPANVRGYTYGGTIELNRKDWAVRYGIWAEPQFANGAPLDPHLLKAHGQALEFEGRYRFADRPGKLRLMTYLNTANMGKYRLALEEMPAAPDVTATRSYRSKYGFLLNWEQEVTTDVGLFARLGWNDGQSESFAFTEIDSLAEIGVLVKGTAWKRPNDTVGLALLANGLSNAHRDYLEAGGLGFIIGDGRLHYAPEEFVELFYNLQLRPGIVVGFDFQGVNHPAYNQDRGPVAIFGLRVHFER